MLSASFLVTSALVANPTQLAIHGGLACSDAAPASRMLFGQQRRGGDDPDDGRSGDGARGARGAGELGVGDQAHQRELPEGRRR